MRTNPTIGELRATFPDHKKKAASYRLWMHYGTRPISYYVSWVLARLGFSADAATMLSLLLGLAGCVLLVLGGYWLMVWGSVLIVAYLVTDAADGNLARVNNTASLWGAYFDGLVNLLVESLIPIAVGIGLYYSTGQILYLVMGLAVILLRLGTNAVGLWHHTILKGEAWDFLGNPAGGKWKVAYWVGKNLICAQTLLLLILALVNALYIFLGLYLLIFAGTLGVAVMKGLSEVRRQK